MKNEIYTKEMLRRERIETLMLMSVLGHKPYRSQAIKELQRRRIVRTQDLLADALMLLS
jgi:hypothetical protein